MNSTATLTGKNNLIIHPATMIATILIHMVQKLQNIFSTAWGWIIAIGVFIGDYFAGHAFVSMLIVAVTLMDAIWGITLSIKQGRFALSELGRLTIAKLTVYGCAMFVFVGIDKQMESTITASIIGSVIVLVEFWSSCGSMSILYPDFAFLRLMRRLLIGEIARKLNIDEEKVEDELNKISKHNEDGEKGNSEGGKEVL